MSDPQPFPDQSTTDALSALSALASQASLHPAYEFSANEEGGGQLQDGEGQPPPPPSSTTNLTHPNHHNEGVEGQWDAAQEQTFAEMVAENEAHREQEAIEVSSIFLRWDGDHERDVVKDLFELQKHSKGRENVEGTWCTVYQPLKRVDGYLCWVDASKKDAPARLPSQPLRGSLPLIQHLLAALSPPKLHAEPLLSDLPTRLPLELEMVSF